MIDKATADERLDRHSARLHGGDTAHNREVVVSVQLLRID